METKQRSLYSLATWKNGLAFKNIHFSPSGMPVVKIAELKNGITNQTQFTEQTFDESVFLHRGDLLFSWSGNPETSIDVFWYNLMDGWLNQHIFKVTPSEGVDRHYLYYLLKSLKPRFQAIASNKQTTGLGHVTIKDLKELMVELPPIEIQRQIGKCLSAYDGRINCLLRINENLLQQAKAALNAYFIDFSRFNGVAPVDWEHGTLQDIVDFTNGYAFKSKDLLDTPMPDCYQVFKQGHINRGGGFNSSGTKSWYPISKCKNLAKYILQKYDVLMAMTDMKDNVAILGNTALMTVSNQYIVNQRVGLLRSNGYKGTSYAYVYLLTNSPSFLRDLRNRANSGVQVNLSSSEIKSSPLLIATEAVNKEFNDLTEPLLSTIIANDIECQRIAALRDTLLPKIIFGELDVSMIGL